MSDRASRSVATRPGIAVSLALLSSLVMFGDDICFSFSPSAMPSAITVIVLLLMVVLLPVLGIGVLINIARLDWRRGIMRAAALTLMVSSVVCRYTVGDYVHLIVMYPHYRSVIAGRTGPVNFEWETTECVGWWPPIQVERTLIYDPGRETTVTTKTEQNPEIQTTYLLGGFWLKGVQIIGCG